MNLVYDKVFITGNFYRHYNYSKPIILGPRKNKKSYRKRSGDSIYRYSINRSRDRLIALSRCNPDLRYFLTLTFAKPGLNLLESNKLFRSFVKDSLRYHHPDLKYIAVPELQKKRFDKRGEFAIHYHLIMNYGYDSRWLASSWGHGFIKIKKISGSDSLVAFYLSKYLSKDFIDEVRKIKPKECHFFYSSRNLNKPLSLYGIKALSFNKLVEDQSRFVGGKFLEDTYLGDISVYNYISLANVSHFFDVVQDLFKSDFPVIIKNEEGIKQQSLNI